MKSSVKLNQLVASLEAIEEQELKDVNDPEISFNEMQEAQIALEGYQDLLVVHNRLTRNGVKVDEQIVANLLSLASPNINKDPLLSTYSQESVADKAKDFGKWIVEKIKAIYTWLIDKIKKLGSKASEVYNKAKNSKIIEKIKNINRSENYKISAKNWTDVIGYGYTVKSVYQFEPIIDIINSIEKNEKILGVQTNISRPFKVLKVNHLKVWSSYNSVKYFPIFLDEENLQALNEYADYDPEQGDVNFKPLSFISLSKAHSEYVATLDEETKNKEYEIKGENLSKQMLQIFDLGERLDESFDSIIKNCEEEIKKAEKYASSVKPADQPFVNIFKTNTFMLNGHLSILRSILITLNTMVNGCENIVSSIVSE